MKNLSISKKLFVGFGVILLLFLITIGMSVYSISGINNEIESYAQYTLPNSTLIWKIRHDMMSGQGDMGLMVNQTDADKVQELLNNVQSNAAMTGEDLAAYIGNQRDTSRDAAIAEMQGFLEKGSAIRKEISELMLNPTEENIEKAQHIYENDYLPNMDRIANILIAFSDTADERALQQAVDAQAAVKFAWLVLAVCGVAAFILSIIMIGIIRKAILTPVNEIVGAYEKIAQGNMEFKIN
ncbi:MAG: hypothetical protein GX376_07350, partial [Firmicutes bacterium]|nr:hypothetical protein [Bacillota bacterium]